MCSDLKLVAQNQQKLHLKLQSENLAVFSFLVLSLKKIPIWTKPEK